MERMETDAARYVRITTVGDLIEARVLAARLHSEGIDVRIHSEALGPYPMTVGQFAEAELWVLSDRVEDANQILLDAEVKSALAPAENDDSFRRGMPFEVRAIAVTVGLVLILLWVVRFAGAI